jgi:hypothetical protein
MSHVIPFRFQTAAGRMPVWPAIAAARFRLQV